MEIELIPILLSLIPTVAITLIALYYFKLHTDNEEKRRRYLLHKENQKQSLPLRLQAYERMVLFLERISPGKLLLRMQPIGENKKDFELLLVSTIEQEFDHNLTQQIYMSDDCWNLIKTAKNGTIALIRKISLKDEVNSSESLREHILKEVIANGAPGDDALSALKIEVAEML